MSRGTDRLPGSLCRWAIVMTLALLGPPARAATVRPRLAVMGVVAGEGVSSKAAATAEDFLLVALDRQGVFSLIGRSDIANLIGLDRAKKLVGCNDESCTAEIAGALGVDYLATANLGHLGRLLVFSLNIIDVRHARAIARVSETVHSEDDLTRAIEAAASEAASRWRDARRPPSRIRGVTWALAATAVACAIAGVILGVRANGIVSGDTVTHVNGETRHTITQGQAQTARQLGFAATGLYAGAGVIAAAAVVTFFALPPSRGQPAQIGISGSF